MAKRPTQSRGYLADQVHGLASQVSNLNTAVARMDVTVATLLESWRRAEASASTYRRGVRQELEAQRSEQQQVSMSVTSIQSDLVKITKTLGEHETERQQLVGAGKVVGAVGKLGWIIVGAIFAGAVSLIAWLASLFPHGMPHGK